MAFFARIDLSNQQSKQLKSTLLTLSGQTQIATISGLTLTNGIGGYVPIVATGGTNYDVLTYVDGTIKLLPQSGSSASGIYSGASPTTITVGGLISGTTIYGSSISNILESILVPTLYPTIIAPSSQFLITPTDVLYEVGDSISILGSSMFSYGSISPAYCGSSSCRSGLVNCYEYNTWGLTTGMTCTIPLANVLFDPHPITQGNNTISAKVYYDAGSQPKDSNGNNYCSPLPSGCTSSILITISGIYPYFYGTASSSGASAGVNRPVATAAFITGGTKIVANSSGTLCINYGSSSDDYIWLAIPNGSTAKTKWYIDYLNNGNIGGSISVGGNLFPSPTTVSGVKTTCWSSQTYNTYISNYQLSLSGIMEFRNT